MNEEQRAVDCDKMAELETYITVDGRELAMLENALALLEAAKRIDKDRIPICDQCWDSLPKLQKRIRKFVTEAIDLTEEEE